MASLLTSNDTVWYLVGYATDGDSTRHIPLNSSPFRIGRRSDLELCLSSRSISKVHAEMIVVGEALFLRDLRSTNGTFLNGRRIEHDTPLGEGDVVQFADIEFRVARQVDDDCERTLENSAFEDLAGIAKFDELLKREAIVPHFQPIVSLEGGCTIGYEALARSTVPGLENPRELFMSAARLRAEPELSELCRRKGIEHGCRLTGSPVIFLNTHPSESLNQNVLASLRSVRACMPDLKIAVEIHEGAITDPAFMQDFRDALTDLNMELAYDDFGAGQSRLLDLAQVPPDYLKFDQSLVRDLHEASAQKQQMVQTLVRMVRDFGIPALAEGVESADEAEACRQLGFQLAQGYYFGRPAPLETWPHE